MVTQAGPAASIPRPKRTSRRNRALPIAILTVIAAAAGAWFLYSKSKNTGITFPTPYQAVLLTNGAVYYGKLQGYTTSHPVLTNVFYIISRTDPNTKQVSNMLVKRGKELHGPDRMYITPSQIVFVETVGANSKVAQLISEANKQ